MAESPSVPPISTFVVRFWREWSVAGSRWRGRIEHVQSGKSATFSDLKGLLHFIRKVGIMANNASSTGEEVHGSE
jgi:hypothetical protein